MACNKLAHRRLTKFILISLRIFCFCRVCVSLRERNRFMGTAAKQQMVANLKNTIWGWKKFIGRRFDDPQVQRERNLLPYEVVEGPNGMAAFKVS